MKKYFFVILCFVLISCFLLGSGFQTALAEDKSKYGGILRVNHTRSAGVIGDPLLIQGWNVEFAELALQTLIIPSNKRIGEMVPELATSWEVAADKSHIIIKLRKGAKFHDGSEFNAQAAKWNLDRWIGSHRPLLSEAKSIDIIDDYTIRVNFSSWDAVTLDDFSHGTFLISPTAFEKNGQEWAKYNPVGTEPFKVAKIKRNTYIKFEKFTGYWEEGLPYLDEIFLTTIPDPMTAAASLRKGEIDAMMGVDPVTATDFKKIGGFDVRTNPGGHLVIRFNSEDPSSVWSDQRVREALEYAVDKEKIAEVVMRGFAFPVYEIIHSIRFSAGEKLGTVPRKYNPEKARQLLKEAGHPEGLKIKISFTSGRAWLRDMFLVMQANLKDVGIEALPNPLAGAARMQKALEPLPPNELMTEGQRGGSLVSLGATKQAFNPGSVYFRGVKKPEGFVDLLDKALKTMDTDEQLKILIEMERMAYGMAMFTPIMGNYFIVIQNPTIKDADWFYAGTPRADLRRAWLDKK